MNESSSPRPAGRIHHVGMRVANLEDAVAWYREVFGFELQAFYPMPSVGRIAFVVNRAGVRLELLQFEGGEATPTWGHPSEAVLRGHSHVALHVSDLEGTVQRAVDRGGRVVMGPLFAAVLAGHAAYIADPDNNLVEVVDTNLNEPQGPHPPRADQDSAD